VEQDPEVLRIHFERTIPVSTEQEPNMSDSRYDALLDYFEALSHLGMPTSANSRLDEICHPDITVHDLDLGHFRGLPYWKAYNERCCRAWPDLEYVVHDEYWANEDSLVVTWDMMATMTEYRAEKHGMQEFVGVKWSVTGMSRFGFEDGLIKDEKDYYDGQGFLRFYENLRAS
jgi:hypothetical protein